MAFKVASCLIIYHTTFAIVIREGEYVCIVHGQISLYNLKMITFEELFRENVKLK